MFHNVLLLLLPVFLAGIIHHGIIIPHNFFSSLAKPIDAGRGWLGPGKTWRGLIVMSLATSLIMTFVQKLWPLPLQLPAWLAGFEVGLAYSLAELPNSWLKRQLAIPSGQRGSGLAGLFFSGLDQVDSVIGCVAVVPTFFSATWGLLLALLLTGTGAHLGVDWLLHRFGYKARRSTN